MVIIPPFAAALNDRLVKPSDVRTKGTLLRRPGNVKKKKKVRLFCFCITQYLKDVSLRVRLCVVLQRGFVATILSTAKYASV